MNILKNIKKLKLKVIDFSLGHKKEKLPFYPAQPLVIATQSSKHTHIHTCLSLTEDFTNF